MTLSLIISAFFMAAVTYIALKNLSQKKEAAFGGLLVVALSLALVIRLIIAYNISGYPWDMGLFKAWGRLCNEVGFGGAYFSEVYLDYPPTYLYVLSFIDNIKNALGLPHESQGYELLIKLPSILADLGIGVILYWLAKKKWGISFGVLAASIYLFCPASIMNSAVWGQIDALCTVIMLGSLILLAKEKYSLSAVLYGIAVATKPQMLIFAPVYFFFAIYKKKFLKLALSLLIALGTLMLLATPFIKDWNYLWLINRYSETINGYLYYTINAYNFWGLIGFNWKPLPESAVIRVVLDLVMPIIATALTGVYMYKKKESSNVFIPCALILSTVYTFGVKMHERYLFPALVFILLAWVFNRDKRFLIAFGGLSTSNFLNTAYAYIQGSDYVSYTDPLLLTISAIHVAFYLYFIVAVFTNKKAPLSTANASLNGKKRFSKISEILSSFKSLPEPVICKKLGRADFGLAISITIIYAIFAFWNLGSTQAANTSWLPENAEEVVLEVNGNYRSMTFSLGISTKNESYYRVGHEFKTETSHDGKTWYQINQYTEEDDIYVYDWTEIDFAAGQYYLKEDLPSGTVWTPTDLTPTQDGPNLFTWKDINAENPQKFVRITSTEDDLVLNEVSFKGSAGFTSASIVSGSANTLLDEQYTVPLYPSYYNSTYFDEIYHARTAFEHLLGVDIYENTHPPLGKLIIAASISIFGMNPFGWRFAGALFGVLMLPILYFIAKRLFGSKLLASGAIILFAFDFMHFTQTRIATIDTYAVFFTLLMYAAMLVFIQKDIFKSSLKSVLLPLALSGIFFGLGSAAKWTCIYGGAGLAALYFWKLYKTYKENKETTFEKNRCIGRICDLCLWCMLLFIIVPLGIYFAAFLPITTLPQHSDNIVGSFISIQESMFSYHSQVVSNHYFGSPWYEWPLAIRNIWYSNCTDFDGTGARSVISALGSPVLWWSGLVGIIFAICAAVKTRLTAPLFLALGFGAMYLPWVLVPRQTFVYHYFTAVPFIILALMYAAFYFKDKKPFSAVLISKGQFTATTMQTIVIGFIAVNLIMFAIFYPVISGAPTTQGYIDALKWMPNWYLG